MKIIQFVKQLNNTELGKGGTHDSYVLIPNELDVSDIFETVNTPISFIDCDSQEQVNIRHTIGREKRIVGLGEYYRSKNLSAGDEIIFERRICSSFDEYKIRVRKNQNRIVFKKERRGFEILTPERMGLIETWKPDLHETFEIVLLTSERKRQDSPSVTDYYDFLVNEESQLASFVGNTGWLSINNHHIQFVNFYGWKKYEIGTEEE